MKLRLLRERTGLSQADIAKVVGVQTPAVNRWENGHTVPTPRHQRRLAKLYKVSVAELGFDHSPRPRVDT